jgi:uncharacterized protein (DUF924 family)
MKPADIIDYWYSDRMRKHWFSSTPELDHEIRTRYEQVWERAAAGEYDHWRNTPEGCLALVIILDQFPLNMFRGKAKSFQSERKAIDIARTALDKGYANRLDKDKLSFLFMPLMHSENLEDQTLSVKLFTEYTLSDNLKFAQHHRDRILMRASTAEELEYLNSRHAFKG